MPYIYASSVSQCFICFSIGMNAPTNSRFFINPPYNAMYDHPRTTKYGSAGGFCGVFALAYIHHCAAVMANQKFRDLHDDACHNYMEMATEEYGEYDNGILSPKGANVRLQFLDEMECFFNYGFYCRAKEVQSLYVRWAMQLVDRKLNWWTPPKSLGYIFGSEYFGPLNSELDEDCDDVKTDSL